MPYNHEKYGSTAKQLMGNSFKIIDYIKYLYTFYAIAIDLEAGFPVFAFG